MKYDAFISYRHLPEDAVIAHRLQSLLEKYRIVDPDTGRKRNIVVFLDDSELPCTDNLSDDIQQALSNSSFLIPILSAETKNSKWCMREIAQFKQQHGNTNYHILPIMISDNHRSALPDELRLVAEQSNHGPVLVDTEPLFADIRADTLRKKLRLLASKEHMRIAAPILGVSFDALYKRQVRKRRHLFGTVAVMLLSGIIAFAVYNSMMLRRIEGKQVQLIVNESERIAQEALNIAENCKLAMALTKAGLDILPEDCIAGSFAEKAAISLLTQEAICKERCPITVQSVINLNTPAYKVLRTYRDGTVVAVTDYLFVYLYDVSNGNLLFSCCGEDVYFNRDATCCVVMYDEEDRTNECIHASFTIYDTLTGNVCDIIDRTLYYEYDSYVKKRVYFPCVFADDATGSLYLGSYYSKYYNSYYNGHLLFYGCQYDFFKEVTIDGQIREIQDSSYPKIVTQCQNMDYDDLKYCYADYALNPETAAHPTTIQQEQMGTELEGSGYTVSGIVPISENLCCYNIDDFSGESSLVVDLQTKCTLCSYDGTIVYDGSRLFILSEGRILNLALDEDCVSCQETIKRSLLDDAGDHYLNLVERDGYYLEYGAVGSAPIICTPVHSYDLNGEAEGVDSNYLFFTNPAMTHIAYMDSEYSLKVQDTATLDIIFEIDIESPYGVVGLALNDEGTRLAVETNVYIEMDGDFRINETYLVIYNLQKETTIQVIHSSCSQDEERNESDAEIFFHGAIEFCDGMLLVSEYNDVLLLPELDDGTYDYVNAMKIECGVYLSPYGMPRYLTKDGLLFIATYSWVYGEFTFIDLYDIETQEKLVINVEGATSFTRYVYDSSSGYLILSGCNPSRFSLNDESNDYYKHFGKNVVFVAKNDGNGNFSPLGHIKSTSFEVELPDADCGNIIDGHYLLLMGENRTEIYDLDTLSLAFSINADSLQLKNGILYDILSLSYNGKTSRYPLNLETADYSRQLVESLRSDVCLRVLTDDEKKCYGIDDLLLADISTDDGILSREIVNPYCDDIDTLNQIYLEGNTKKFNDALIDYAMKLYEEGKVITSLEYLCRAVANGSGTNELTDILSALQSVEYQKTLKDGLTITLTGINESYEDASTFCTEFSRDSCIYFHFTIEQDGSSCRYTNYLFISPDGFLKTWDKGEVYSFTRTRSQAILPVLYPEISSNVLCLYYDDSENVLACGSARITD